MSHNPLETALIKAFDRQGIDMREPITANKQNFIYQEVEVEIKKVFEDFEKPFEVKKVTINTLDVFKTRVDGRPELGLFFTAANLLSCVAKRRKIEEDENAFDFDENSTHGRGYSFEFKVDEELLRKISEAVENMSHILNQNTP